MSYIWRGLTSQNRSGVSSFYLCDSQGSVRNLVNAAGAITDTYLTTAFGVELLTGSGTVNPFRYVGLLGYYRDMPELMQVRARWLAAVLARWLSRAGFEQVKAGEHSYGYAFNNPVRFVDPFGTDPRLIGPEGTDCKERDTVLAGLKLACEAIKSKTGQACVNRLSSGYRDCIKNWCHSDVALTCGSKECAEKQCKDPHGCTTALTNQPLLVFKCHITICTGIIGNPECRTPGGLSTASVEREIAITLLHEAMHCCGMGDRSRDRKDPNNPAEDVARCILGIPGHVPAYD